MRTKNLTSVLTALQRGNSPKTIAFLMGVTGLSYSTVCRALAGMGAEKVPDTWPVEWRIPAETQGLLRNQSGPSLVKGEGTPSIQVELVEDSSLLSRWEERKEAFTAELRLLSIQPDSDPRQIRAALSNGAKALASLAWAIQQHEDQPDWYEAIGGQIEQDLPTIPLNHKKSLVS